MDLFSASFKHDIQLALVMVFFLMIFNFVRSMIGSVRVSLVFAATITYLTFYKHEMLVWSVVILIFLTTFVKGFLGSVKPIFPSAKQREGAGGGGDGGITININNKND
jgi:hypothetical protein